MFEVTLLFFEQHCASIPYTTKVRYVYFSLAASDGVVRKAPGPSLAREEGEGTDGGVVPHARDGDGEATAKDGAFFLREKGYRFESVVDRNEHVGFFVYHGDRWSFLVWGFVCVPS